VSVVEKSIDVRVPLRMAYNQWTQFEEFPKFMDAVREVTRLDGRRLHWRANMGGQEKEWDAVITEQVPDTRIAWRDTRGAKNSGVVTFQPLADDMTRVTVQMEYDPEGFIENVGDMLGVISQRVESDLIHFKAFIEARARETGAWRGEIPHEKG
jgi:uncharacterized membrane protein